MLVSRCGRIVRWRCFLVPCHKVATIYAFEHAYYPEARLLNSDAAYPRAYTRFFSILRKPEASRRRLS
jgi:hypothetical protein